MADIKESIHNFSVIIEDPNTETGMNSEILFFCIAEFCEHPTPYGNGYALYIKSADGKFDNFVDLRYDETFDPDSRRAYLIKWMANYWTGKNGAYHIKAIHFTY